MTAQVGGKGALAGTSIRLPLYFDIAYATARLAAVICTSETKSVTVAATPGIAVVWIVYTPNSMTDFSRRATVSPAALANIALAKITGHAHVDVVNMSEASPTFTSTDIASGTNKRSDTHNFMQSAVTSALKDLKLQVQVTGIGLTVPGTLLTDVASSLGAVAAPLDEVLYMVLTTLGLHLGEADVTVQGIRCLGRTVGRMRSG